MSLQVVVNLAGAIDPPRMCVAARARMGPGLPWYERDFTRLNIGERSTALDRLVAEDRHIPHDTDLPRMTLVRLGWDRFHLVVSADPVLLDSSDVPALTYDLLRPYAAEGDALPPRRYPFTVGRITVTGARVYLHEAAVRAFAAAVSAR